MTSVKTKTVSLLSKVLLGMLTFLATSLCVSAAEVAYEWDASPDTNVVGYRLYVVTNNVIERKVYTTNNWASVTNHPAGVPVKLYATALNALNLESDPSDSITVTVPLPPLRLKIKARMEQASSVNGPWLMLCDLGEQEIIPQEDFGFVRVKMDINRQ